MLLKYCIVIKAYQKQFGNTRQALHAFPIGALYGCCFDTLYHPFAAIRAGPSKELKISHKLFLIPKSVVVTTCGQTYILGEAMIR